MLGRRRQRGREIERAALLAEGAEAVDVGGAERQRLADDGRTGAGGLNLRADSEIAGEEPEADRHAVGREPGPDEMIKAGPIDQFVERLLHAPAPAVEGRELLRPAPLDAGHVPPGPAAGGGGAGRGRKPPTAGEP